MRALPIASRKLGAVGECDIVEFHKCDDGVSLRGHRGLYSIYPIEYKKGKPKVSEEDKLQLVVQTMALEEMFSTQIEEGAIYYGETRRREVVQVSQELRDMATKMFEEMHDYFKRGYTPKVKQSKSCNSCSLKDICLPRLNKAGSVKNYISQMLGDNVE